MSEAAAVQAVAEDPILRVALDRIVGTFSPRRVVLFGSRATGSARSDSDYDLLVLLDGEPDVRRMSGRIRGRLADLPAAFDILVRPFAWWQQWCDTPLSTERRIQREGRVLYAGG